MRQVMLHILPLILILALFLQSMAHARHASITFDEGPHLAVGYATLRTGDFRLQPVHIHPPLANGLAAAPLLLQRDLPDPRTIGGWEISSLSAITDAIVWQYPNPRHIAIAGRFPIVGLGIILAALVFRWAADYGKQGAGLLAMACLAFDPNVVAHSSLITTDIAAVTFIFLTLYLTDRWLRYKRKAAAQKSGIRCQNQPLKKRSKSPRTGTVFTRHRRFKTSTRQGNITGFRLTENATPIGIGLSMGLAQLTKVSALMLIPVIVGLFILNAWSRSKARWRGIRAVIPTLLLILAITALTVWAGYGFGVRTIPELSPVPIPAATHVEVFRSLRQHYELGHPTFAAGKLSLRGWWWYFPLAFLIKTPLPFLILLALTGIRMTIQVIRSGKQTRNWIRHGALWVFPALYGIASLFSSVNIGYRHLLPILPLLMVGIGVGFSRLRESTAPPLRQFTWRGTALAVLLAWQAFGTLRVLPHPLTFFNESIGGPSNGYRYLVDSNLDWGQNLWDLKAWMDRQGEEHVNYAHYSPARPQAYGINASYLPPDPRAGTLTPWAPSPGLYAIGATVLQGPYASTPNTYAWFRSRTPVARLGNAIFLYRIESQPAPNWAVLCQQSGLSAQEVQNALNQPDLRIVPLDCSQAQVRPAQEPGLIAMPKTSSPPEGGKLELALRDKQGAITSMVYRIENMDVQTDNPNLTFEDRLTFLNFTVTPPSDHDAPLILRTYWRIEDRVERPLSIMAHVVGPGGEVVAVGDKLSYPIEYWHPGDILIQTHRLELPKALAPKEYALQTGIYWLYTMERWSVKTTSGKANAITLAKMTLP